MKDFREEIKQMPIQRPEHAEIEAIFSRGNLREALKTCKKFNYNPEQFQEGIDQGARKMLLAKRAGELLSLVYEGQIKCKYDTPMLLRAMVQAGDIPNFLKQAHRFQIYKGFEEEIRTSILWLRERKQYASADAYEKKFNELRK